MADTIYGNAIPTGGDLGEDSSSEYYGGPNAKPRFPGLYVGNLTWWTTDQDVINAINSLRVTDVQEVKFFENRNNGQSKGFCVVTFGSEASLPVVMEKLPKLELYGQNPVVTPYNRQNLNLFESQTKTRLSMNPGTNGPGHAAGVMGISSISGVHAGTQGLPYSGMNSYGTSAAGLGPRAGPFNPNMRFQMRTPRTPMRNTMPGTMNNVPGALGGGMMPGGGHPMNRMRFMPPQAWNNMQQGPYNSTARLPPVGMQQQPQQPQQQLDDRALSRRTTDDRSSSRRDDERSLSRREDDRSSSRRDDGGSSQANRRDERSSRKEDKPSSSSSSSRRERSHRSDDRARSRSRERSNYRSREREERRDRSRDREERRDRSRDVEDRRDRRDRYR